MKRPLNRGAAINPARYQTWLGRFSGYRNPVTHHLIEQWLAQFAEEDRDLAARILDAVLFIDNQRIDNAFRQLLGQLPGWNKARARRRGRWFFVPFSTTTGESGDTMLHQLRIATSMTGSKYSDLFIHRSDLVLKQPGADDTVVLVDDFAGTGNQASKAWPTFQELITGGSRVILMLVAATKDALLRISQETEMKPICGTKLRPGDNFFRADCKHFTQAEKNKTFQYCTRADPQKPRGWGDAGLLIVLCHRTPNNSIPILHENNRRWRGLFPRHG